MKVLDIFDGNQNLIDRVPVEDLEFNPSSDCKATLGYAQSVVFEYALEDWYDNKNIDTNEDRNKYRDAAEAYATEEANYAGFKIKEVADKI